MNLADDLQRSAARNPDRVALIFGDQSITYEDLNKQADRVAAGLYKIGVRKGDRVVFSIANRPAFAAVHYGVLRAGAVSVPINPRLTASELRPYISYVTPRVIIAEESAANEVMSAGPYSSPVFVIGKHSKARPFEEVLGDEPPDVTTEAEDLAVLAYTSGTAGSPKAAALTHGNLTANIEQMIEIPGAKTEPDDLVLGLLPMFHIYAMNVILGLSVRQGASVLLLDRFDPERTLGAIANRAVTVLVGAPPMFVSWLTLPQPERFDLSRVRFAISGASALAPEIIRAFRERFGVEIWEGYGLTESSPTLTTTRMGEQRPGSVGRHLDGVEIRIAGPDGEEAMTGDPGEVWVRGPNVFSGYWNDPDATSLVFTADGWFKTGDLGFLDEDKYLWLVDRKKELIIVSGFNVFPKEVEDALLKHPGVADAAVMGVPHERQGESIRAYVVPVSGSRLSKEELIIHCTKNLARFKVPSQIEIVSSLPRMPSGKVVKRLLRPTELESP